MKQAGNILSPLKSTVHSRFSLESLLSFFVKMFPFVISSTYLFFENSCAVLSDEFDIFLLQVHVGNALKWKIKDFFVS